MHTACWDAVSRRLDWVGTDGQWRLIHRQADSHNVKQQ